MNKVTFLNRSVIIEFGSGRRPIGPIRLVKVNISNNDLLITAFALQVVTLAALFLGK